eukprot:gene21051-40998_t
MYEYEIEAELLHEFRRNGAQAPAYTPIVATGANACVLHYVANNAQSRDGDLVLIDAGCEFDSYASDITRTYPVNGRFSAPQRALYELVLAAQSAALAAIRPGALYTGMHDAAVHVLAQGMLDLGLLDKATFGSAENVVAERAHLPFYMHGTGHWLGLDVHDVGAYRDVKAEGKPSRPLQAGMVVTVEPGIYVRPGAGVPEQFWNIGIRIEDDIVVTADGHRNLSADAPKTIAEIEAVMRGAAAICGAGPVGMALAALLVKRGMAPAGIALIDARPLAAAQADPRSLALSYGSSLLLDEIGAWPVPATAIHQIHVS